VIGSLSTSTVVTQQYYPVEANLSLDITPYVSADENVTLTLGVNITAFTDNNSTNTTTPPPTTTSKFKSIIRVKNEETVLLGGIETNEKDESSSGTPILDKIPVLKWLFSSRSKSDTKTVSIVFIKPTIIF
jgi:type IV pilus assembly protein PilQ